MTDLDARFSAYRSRLAEANQEHLLRFWSKLSDNERLQLLNDLDQIDFELCGKLIETLVKTTPELALSDQIEPAPIFPSEPDQSMSRMYAEALTAGSVLIAEGKVAAFTVAGGQGTRLGYDGPKEDLG